MIFFQIEQTLGLNAPTFDSEKLSACDKVFFPLSHSLIEYQRTRSVKVFDNGRYNYITEIYRYNLTFSSYINSC